LNISSDKNIQKVVIYNSIGQIVLTTQENANVAKINIAELTNGLYTVKTVINGVDTFSKIVKE